MSNREYDRQYYNDTKADPVAYPIYLESKALRRRIRTRKLQDKRIEEAAIRLHGKLIEMGQVDAGQTFADLRTDVRDYYCQLAMAVLYPERKQSELNS